MTRRSARSPAPTTSARRCPRSAASCRSTIDDDAACKQRVVDMSLLWDDLNDSSKTPALSFISPDLCADGHDEKCVDGKSPGGYEGIEKSLLTLVPRILNSTAYRQDG